MAYTRPDTYVEVINRGDRPVDGSSPASVGFVGITKRGNVNEAVMVSNWTDFVEKFGFGSPFMAESYLPLAVYGHFQNGGGLAYIKRVAGENSAKATATIGTDTLISAKEEGEWGNELKVKISKEDKLYILTVEKDGDVLEEIEVDSEIEDFEETVNYESKYITVEHETSIEEGEEQLEGGDSDLSSLVDQDYLNGLDKFKSKPDLGLVTIPGETSDSILQGLIAFATENDKFAIMDAPLRATVDELIDLRNKLSGKGELHAPFITISDPETGRNRPCPASGHVAGMYVRTINERGFHKDPAGVGSVIRGAISLETHFTEEEHGLLNKNRVNCIVQRDGAGFVMWGTRSLHPQPLKRYVSDVLYENFLIATLYANSDWVVFEPNTSDLRSSLEASFRGFMTTQWENGALKGSSPSEAFYVKCDDELNPESVVDKGQVITEIGYAKVKPAEFVIFRLVQQSSL